MNIKIEFNHENAKTPKFVFEEIVAIKSDCDPKLWLTGKVTSLQLDSNNTWNYTVLRGAVRNRKKRPVSYSLQSPNILFKSSSDILDSSRLVSLISRSLS